jgi:hypothetical protein
MKFFRHRHKQSILVARSFGLARARHIARTLGKTSDLERTRHYYRFRQESPRHFARGSFRTQRIRPGVEVVWGKRLQRNPLGASDRKALRIAHKIAYQIWSSVKHRRFALPFRHRLGPRARYYVRELLKANNINWRI